MNRIAALLFIALCASGCVQSHFNVASGRQDYSMTSTQKEVDIGRKLAKKVVEETPPVANEALQDRVETLGQRLAAVSDRREVIYSFMVLDEEDVNAFALPGGYIFLYRGLVEKTKNDDELASVLAHEIAHVAARHSANRRDANLGMTLAQLATLATREGAAIQGAGVALQMTALAHAREAEIEADRLAVKYMKAAGFDPMGVLMFLETMQKVNQDELHHMSRGVTRPQYGMTHPFVPERILSAKEAIFGVADYIDYLNVVR